MLELWASSQNEEGGKMSIKKHEIGKGKVEINWRLFQHQPPKADGLLEPEILKVTSDIRRLNP